MLDLVIQVRIVQKGFGRDTANVKTSASKRATGLDTRGLVVELSQLDGVHVPAWATADDDGVVVTSLRRVESDELSDIRSQHNCSVDCNW
ncbi:hypothetical protein METSCH_B06380 [Metschnikowia aff. pulcherrima]|uniref:Uncharacterized protein n=1 Tax=Metschnikowia aff. pulcherrima TaxID=2163413 RepID=A0A4P6XMH6_9ASCO|nr:hypothetical protein METSCH_B06380 [Metschnikowia aff. pulcherrima]